MARKAPAADRTIDIFSGKTKLEEQTTAVEVLEETHKGSETIEQAAERWRNNAFFTAEHLSKHFPDAVDQGVFRITEKGDLMLLEQFRKGKTGAAFHWSGVMFHKSDLYELTNVFVTAARARKASEGNGSTG